MSDQIDDARIRSLAGVARTLGRSAQLDAMIEVAAEEALHALAAASVSISRLEQGTGGIRTVINVGNLGPDEKRWPTNEVYRLDDFMKLQAVVGELRIWTMSVHDADADPGELALLRALGKGSSMGAPLVVDGKLRGELYATRQMEQPAFSDTDAAYSEALSAILAGAISRALHVDSLERMAFLDPLTGLANRRALDEAATLALDTVSERSGRRVSVVALDLNRLKDVNDAFGHSEGDRLLTSVARLLQQRFARLHGSLVARVGGDEFTVLVPGHDIAEVMETANDVCASASDLPLGAGFSCGVATAILGEVDDPFPLLFRAADRAQYAAKRAAMLNQHAEPVPVELVELD